MSEADALQVAAHHGAGAPERLHGLDAVRAMALLMVVTMHATLSFLPGAQLWFVADVERSLALAIVAYVLRMYQMMLFFIVAGFFAHGSFRRLGRRAFVRDRLTRIALPLAVAWPITLACFAGLLAWIAAMGANDTLPVPARPAPTFTPDDFPLLHLWFLWILLLLYGATLLIGALVDRWDPRHRAGAVADRVIGYLVTRRVPLLLALPVALALYRLDPWYVAAGIPTPGGSLVATLPAWVAFGSAFALGWFVQRQPRLLEVWQRRWHWNVALALVATLACLAVLRHPAMPTLAAHDGIKLAYAGCFAAGAWCWAFGIIGIGLRFMTGFSATRRYVADASYWVYLIHLPIIVALQVAVARLQWPWMVKFPLILGLGGVVMVVSYQWLVRYTVIGAVLTGRRCAAPARHPHE